MPGSMSANLGARRPALLALRRRIPSARQPAEAFRLPGAVVAGARFVHSRQPERLRSEEHTSELQSLTNLVCRLLLEKKNISDIALSQTHRHASEHCATT